MSWPGWVGGLESVATDVGLRGGTKMSGIIQVRPVAIQRLQVEVDASRIHMILFLWQCVHGLWDSLHVGCA